MDIILRILMAKKKSKPLRRAISKLKKKISLKTTKLKVKKRRSVSAFRKPRAKPAVPAAPVKPKKNYKLPNYKKKCIECAQFKFIKGGWSLCMQCYEKRYGKYMGEDRFLYVQPQLYIRK
jgi:hypothetical protein